MANRKYRIELGINLHAATIPRTNPNLRLFPLQDALVDLTDPADPQPAWYTRLQGGDEMSFRLIDISDLGSPPQPPPSYPELSVIDFIFTDPRTRVPKSPFADPPASWRISESSFRHLPSPVYSRTPGQDLPTWDVVGCNAQGGEVPSVLLAPVAPGDDFQAFGLAVVLKTVRDGWFDQFIFDPEMIVSETDGDTDGG